MPRLEDETAIYARAGEISMAANAAILRVELLTIDDVKRYLIQGQKADRVLEQGLPHLAKRFREAGAIQRKYLDTWDVDRSDALFYLLYALDMAHRQERIDAEGACVKCVMTLVEEPLIPHRDPDDYRRIVLVSEKALRLSKEEIQSPMMFVHQAHTLGIQWNAERFCPRIFPEEITPQIIEEDRLAFVSALQILQGRSPFIQ